VLPTALRHVDFRRLWISMLCSGFAMQMAAVAIGWQVYEIHHSAFDLGLIGLPARWCCCLPACRADR
jgi:hypothetical protein